MLRGLHCSHIQIALASTAKVSITCPHSQENTETSYTEEELQQRLIRTDTPI